jgi:hypothetical protein
MDIYLQKNKIIIILKNEMYVQVNLLPKGDNIRNFMIVYLKKKQIQPINLSR